MATRKQRRRREKTLRHEYGFVVNDEEGNEVELAGSELRARKGSATTPKPGAKPAASKPAARKGTRRAVRDPEPPSWRRSARRAALWCPAIIAVSYLFLRGLTVPARILLGLGYSAFFVPMTYWMDGLVYRRFVRRRDAGGPTGKTR